MAMLAIDGGKWTLMPGNGSGDGWVGGDVRKGKLGDGVGGSWSSSLQTLRTCDCLRRILSNPVALIYNITYEECAERLRVCAAFLRVLEE